MNEQLRNELEAAFNTMADIEDIQKLSAEYQNRINAFDAEYKRIKGYPARKWLQSGVVFLISLSVVGLIVNYMSEQAIESFGNYLLLIVPIAIILNLVRIIVTEKNRKQRADSWWEKNAQPQVAALRNEINGHNKAIYVMVSDNSILSKMPAGMRTCDTVYDLLMIVEQGKAYTLSAAMDVWFNKQENRRFREDMLDNMERIQSNQRELQGGLSKANQQLGDLSYMEEMHYWEHKK